MKLLIEANEFISGEIEVDESYFGGRRKGKRGRGASGTIHLIYKATTRNNMPRTGPGTGSLNKRLRNSPIN